jgi:TonB family protein
VKDPAEKQKSKDPAETQSRRRMLVSIALAFVLHGLVFVGVQYGIRAEEEETEELIGPVMVTLYEPGQEIAASPDSAESRPRGEEPGQAESKRERRLFDRIAEEKTPDKTRREEREPAVSKPLETGHPEITEKEPTPRIERRDTGDEPSEELYQKGGILEQWEREAPQEIGRQSEQVESDQPFVIDKEYQAEEDVRETGPVRASQPDEENAAQDLAFNMDQLDEVLEESRGGAGTGSTDSDARGGQARAEPGSGMPRIVWDDASSGRVLLSSGGLPRIPEWVKREGLVLKVEVAFSVTPEGHTTSLSVLLSSGYPDVDASVLESVRKLRFNPIQDDRYARGKIRYLISKKQ